MTEGITRIKCTSIIREWLSFDDANGILKLVYEPPHRNAVKKLDTSKHKIEISIPESMMIKGGIFNIGTGSLNLSKHNFKNLKLALGTGETMIDSVTTESLLIECGTGSIHTETLTVTSNTQIHLSGGNSVFGGLFQKMLYIEGGTGRIDFNFR